MAISGTTRLVALLGHPVAQSLSPRMQNAAFAARALDWAYVALDDLHAGQTLVDLPYPRTATAGAAARNGATVFDGLDVLVAQGAKSFELWTGVEAPVDVMRAAVRAAGPTEAGPANVD